MNATMSSRKPFPAPLADADDICRLDARQLVSGYGAGSLSPVEVIHAVLKRADVVNARFNAFTRIDPEGALQAARLSEQRWRRKAPMSAVDGVPTTVKDILWVEGWPVSYGSYATDDRVSAADAPAVELLRKSGVIFFGQTTTPEFGWKAVTDSPRWGITRNPWDPTKTSGGSSGGAAVAAATGAGVFHIGTDGGGSIRIPAAFTGIVGLKPTFGRVPAYPASAFGTVAHIGPMARSIGDVEAMLRVMSGRDLRDWNQPSAATALEASECDIRTMKIGFWSRPPIGGVDAEISRQVERAVAHLSNSGARIEPIELPEADYHKIFRAHWYSGAANRLSLIPQNRWAELDQGFVTIAEAGTQLTVLDYVKAQTARASLGADMDVLLSRFDLLLSPAAAVQPFAVGVQTPDTYQWPHWTDWASFSFPMNLSQQPACVLPFASTSSGLPIGLQIVGSRGADGKVLKAAEAIELALSGFRT